MESRSSSASSSVKNGWNGDLTKSTMRLMGAGSGGWNARRQRVKTMKLGTNAPQVPRTQASRRSSKPALAQRVIPAARLVDVNFKERKRSRRDHESARTAFSAG
jgi:hypothetical protein